MPITLPEWAHTLPNPAHAPSPEAVARILEPLSRLILLLEEGRSYGSLSLGLCTVAGIGAPKRATFKHDTPAPSSAHAKIANPWLRTGDTSPIPTLLARANAVVDVLDAMFAGLLHRREAINAMGDADGIHFVLMWPYGTFVLSPRPDSVLHLATLLVVLQRALATTPAIALPPGHPDAPDHAARMDALRAQITPLGRHINTFFPKDVWI